MNLGKISKHKSWLTSAGIAIAITAWILTGQVGGDDDTDTVAANQETEANIRTSVRVRTQTAMEVTRTITINGKTAPARTVELNAETDGRVVAIGVERGERLDRGQVIVRLDERDRHARLSQAQAIVKQRELEYV